MLNLIVCGVEEIDKYVDGVEAVISILNEEEREREPISITNMGREKPEALLRLNFDDIWREIYQSEEEELITAEILERGIKFVRDTTEQEIFNILIHCHAGISRSSGVAIAIYTALIQNPQEAVQRVSEQRPQAVPNIEVIRVADELLEMQGELIDAVWEVFYGSLSEFLEV